jgi:hypothetical protein
MSSFVCVEAQAPVSRRAANPNAARELVLRFFIMISLTPEFS